MIFDCCRNFIPRSGGFPWPFEFGGLKGFDGAMEFLHGGVGELEGVEGKAVHKGGEGEGGGEPGFLGVPFDGAAGVGDEGEDGGKFPHAPGVSAVLEGVVVSFGCAGSGPAASSGHGRPPRGGYIQVYGWGKGCGRPTRGAHTLGDWPVVPTGEVDKGEGEGGDGRSVTLKQ